jgi:hypothetical protein
MDWTQLRVLDFGHIASMLPLESLAGHVSQLDCLTVSISSEERHNMHDPERTIPILEE